MHWFIPSSGDALIAQEKLFPNAGATQNHIRVQPALFAAGMHAKIPYVLDVGSGLFFDPTEILAHRLLNVG